MAMRRVDPAGATIRWSEVHARRRYVMVQMHYGTSIHTIR